MNNSEYKNISDAEGLQAFRVFLKSCALPFEDVSLKSNVHLMGCFEDGRLIGTAALEVYETVGLLRSVAVAPSHRSKNLGKNLTSKIIEKAEAANLSALYLLTETAQAFFENLGFQTVARDGVPTELRSSTEFDHVCPASAVAMRLSLKR